MPGKSKAPTTALLAAAGAAASASILVLGPGFGLSRAAANAGALAVAAIILWSTRLVPENVTTIGFFLVAALFSGAPLDVVFSGFSSPAFWLTMGGLVIGVAINRTGLASRIAVALSAPFRARYWRAITGAALIGVALAVLMPSTMGRVVLLIPIVATLAEHLGFA